MIQTTVHSQQKAQRQYKKIHTVRLEEIIGKIITQIRAIPRNWRVAIVLIVISFTVGSIITGKLSGVLLYNICLVISTPIVIRTYALPLFIERSPYGNYHIWKRISRTQQILGWLQSTIVITLLSALVILVLHKFGLGTVR